jgi:hypothetical protein
LQFALPGSGLHILRAHSTALFHLTSNVRIDILWRDPVAEIFGNAGVVIDEMLDQETLFVIVVSGRPYC